MTLAVSIRQIGVWVSGRPAWRILVWEHCSGTVVERRRERATLRLGLE